MRNREPVEAIYLGLFEQILEICRALQRFGLRVPCVGFTNTEQAEPFVKSGGPDAWNPHPLFWGPDFQSERCRCRPVLA